MRWPMKENSLKDRAYNIIKEKIVSCEYAPTSFLIESELIDQIGASRTPIREALNKLEQGESGAYPPQARGAGMRNYHEHGT